MDLWPRSTGYPHQAQAQPWQPKSQREVQRLLEAFMAANPESTKLDPAMDAACAQQITARELRGLIRSIEIGLTI